MDHHTEDHLKKAGVEAAIGTALGVASSFANTTTPHSHHHVASVAAHGGRVATDAFRHSIRHGATILGATGAGAVAVGSAAAGGVSAAAAATVATAAAVGTAAVVAAPFVLAGAAVYGLYRLFRD